MGTISALWNSCRISTKWWRLSFFLLIALGQLWHFPSADLRYIKIYIVFYSDQTVKIVYKKQVKTLFRLISEQLRSVTPACWVGQHRFLSLISQMRGFFLFFTVQFSSFFFFLIWILWKGLWKAFHGEQELGGGEKHGSGNVGKGLLMLGQSMYYLYDGIYVFM